VRETLIALVKLQKIDTQALEIEQSALRIPDQIQSLEETLEKQRLELGRMNAEAETQRTEQTELEGHVSEESAKHQKWKRRLNDIKSPREYQALSRELEMGERQVHDMEDKLLELTQDLENKQKAIDEKVKALREEEMSARTQIHALRRSEADFKQRVEEASSGREQIAAGMPSRIVKKYEQLRKSRSGIAVAEVVGGTCTGCQMKVRPQLVITLMRGDSFEFCPSCKRFMVHETIAKEAEDGASAPASGDE
jgi:predicted  nucleic acid-binding Zn-ribbon protein